MVNNMINPTPNITPVITADKELLLKADKIIFPGVGEARNTMQYLRDNQLDRLPSVFFCSISNSSVAEETTSPAVNPFAGAKKYKSYRGQEGKIAKNILNRNFKAEKPNEKWATDVTEFALCNEKNILITNNRFI